MNLSFRNRQIDADKEYAMLYNATWNASTFSKLNSMEK